MEFPDIVELNVGGRHVSTFLSTLTKYPDSMLAAMFSGRQPVTRDKNDRFFIDADADVFTHLLNFLRFETMPPSDKVIQVKQYAEYYGIDELKTRVNVVTLSPEETFVAKLKSSIPGYSESFLSAKEQLMTCDISTEYIFLIVKMNTCPKGHFCSGQILNLPHPLQPKSYSILQEIGHFEDGRLLKILLLLLSHDLKKYGIVKCSETQTNRCCQYYRLFKVDM